MIVCPRSGEGSYNNIYNVTPKLASYSVKLKNSMISGKQLVDNHSESDLSTIEKLATLHISLPHISDSDIQDYKCK